MAQPGRSSPSAMETARKATPARQRIDASNTAVAARIAAGRLAQRRLHLETPALPLELTRVGPLYLSRLGHTLAELKTVERTSCAVEGFLVLWSNGSGRESPGLP